MFHTTRSFSNEVKYVIETYRSIVKKQKEGKKKTDRFTSSFFYRQWDTSRLVCFCILYPRIIISLFTLFKRAEKEKIIGDGLRIWICHGYRFAWSY